MQGVLVQVDHFHARTYYVGQLTMCASGNVEQDSEGNQPTISTATVESPFPGQM